MGTTACPMQMRSRYRMPDSPHSHATSTNRARVGERSDSGSGDDMVGSRGGRATGTSVARKMWNALRKCVVKRRELVRQSARQRFDTHLQRFNAALAVGVRAARADLIGLQLRDFERARPDHTAPGAMYLERQPECL